ncbi:ECF transporter S component, partial [Bacillus vallismortis]|nr:ECF transporter S component [Bacillus vallismortis]
KEIVIMSVISIVFAIVYLLFTHLGNVLAGMFGPIAYEPIYGIWFIVSINAAYMIRKPGAALISEVIAALVEFLQGNPTGPMVIVIGIV